MENNKNGMVETVVEKNLEAGTVSVATRAASSNLNFKARVIKHLEGSKTNVLKISEKGLYHHKGKDLPYAHILPKEKADYNLLKKYRSSYIVYRSMKRIVPHKYFHHLNSSQAMCINFFYPLMEKKRLGAILSLLGIPGEPVYDRTCFDKESELEGKNTRNTNFDFYMETSEKKKVFFEIKYTEDDFAKNKTDAEHMDKYKRTYAGLVKKSLALAEDVRNEAFFLTNYQVMRNLVHIDADSYVVFVYTEGNKVIANSARIAKTEMLKEEWRDHLILLTWEELLNYAGSHPDLAGFGDYFSKDFTEKYLIQ